MSRFAKFSAIVLLAGCAAGSEDPLEPINRPVHQLNKGLDTVLVRPASQAYGAIVPPEVQNGVRNFSNNLGQPTQFVNYVLQGNIENAAHSFARFAVNSTFGVAGLFDVAGRGGMTDRPTDFGATLNKWGVPQGPYIEVPALGPNTARSAVGIIADSLINPLRQLNAPERRIVLAATGLEIIDIRHRFRTVVNALLYESSDSYTITRDAYLQNRSRALGQEIQLEDLEDPYAFE